MLKHDEYIQTHQKLIDGIITLMDQTAAQRISITSVVKLCHVNRSTFYLHFVDMQAALDEIETQLISNIKNRFNDVPSDWILSFNTEEELAFYRKILTVVNRDFKTYQALLGRNGDPEFLFKMHDQLSPYFAPQLTKPTSLKNSNILRELIIQGLIDTLLLWIQKLPQISVNDMADLLLYSRHNAPYAIVQNVASNRPN